MISNNIIISKLKKLKKINSPSIQQKCTQYVDNNLPIKLVMDECCEKLLQRIPRTENGNNQQQKKPNDKQTTKKTYANTYKKPLEKNNNSRMISESSDENKTAEFHYCNHCYTCKAIKKLNAKENNSKQMMINKDKTLTLEQQKKPNDKQTTKKTYANMYKKQLKEKSKNYNKQMNYCHYYHSLQDLCVKLNHRHPQFTADFELIDEDGNERTVKFNQDVTFILSDDRRTIYVSDKDNKLQCAMIEDIDGNLQLFSKQAEIEKLINQHPVSMNTPKYNFDKKKDKTYVNLYKQRPQNKQKNNKQIKSYIRERIAKSNNIHK